MCAVYHQQVITLMPRHVIRLRGPWEYRPLARTVRLADGSSQVESGELPAAGRIEVPSDWGESLGGTFCGRVAYLRRFGRPTGLSAADRVELVITRVDARAGVRLNGQALGEIPAGGAAWRCDITARLAPRNELVIEVELPRVTDRSLPLPRAGREGLPGGLVGQVRLEITAADGG